MTSFFIRLQRDDGGGCESGGLGRYFRVGGNLERNFHTLHSTNYKWLPYFSIQYQVFAIISIQLQAFILSFHTTISFFHIFSKNAPFFPANNSLHFPTQGFATLLHTCYLHTRLCYTSPHKGCLHFHTRLRYTSPHKGCLPFPTQGLPTFPHTRVSYTSTHEGLLVLTMWSRKINWSWSEVLFRLMCP